jgi:hypothetical protein
VQQFTDIQLEQQVFDGQWGWGACFLDIDNDTDLDIYHTNGWPSEYLNMSYVTDRSRVFVSRHGNGSTGFFESAVAFGLDDSDSGRGVICADFDHDGDIDILQLTNRTPNSGRLWQNLTAAAGRSFLRVRLIGSAPNTAAAGARIFARIGQQTQMREITIGGNFTSQTPAVQVFGLGSATSVDELRVEWPARLPGPVPPEQWIKTNVPAGSAGQTLVICHPHLTAPPADCTAADG